MEPFEINFETTIYDYTIITESEIQEHYIGLLELYPEITKDDMIDRIVEDLIDGVLDYASNEFGGDVSVSDADRWDLQFIVEQWVNERWDLDDHAIAMADGQLLLFDPDEYNE